MRFYTTCFGFREPFKVLCDGTFIHHLVVNRIRPPDTSLSNILGASVKIFTTRCVLAELKSLGDSHSASLNEGRNLIPARCGHEKRKSAVACIEEVIGENNPEHFFVATQDVDLRRKFQEIPAVPVIFGLRNALFLEPPSASQLNFAKSDEEKRLHMTELEYKMLQFRKKKRQALEEPGDSSDANEGAEDQILLNHALNTNSARKSTDGKDKVQFKRKKAKGPNPLSCKKKKSNESPKPVSRQQSTEDDATVRSRSKRKRKRSHKNKILAETTG